MNKKHRLKDTTMLKKSPPVFEVHAVDVKCE